MALKIEIVGSTFDDLKNQVAALAVSLGMGGFSDRPFPEERPETIAEPKKAPKEKKAKAEATPAATSEPATLESASAKLKALNDAKGISVAREVLAVFGCNRMSEISPDKYADVIAECDKRLA